MCCISCCWADDAAMRLSRSTYLVYDRRVAIEEHLNRAYTANKKYIAFSRHARGRMSTNALIRRVVHWSPRGTKWRFFSEWRSHVYVNLVTI